MSLGLLQTKPICFQGIGNAVFIFYILINSHDMKILRIVWCISLLCFFPISNFIPQIYVTPKQSGLIFVIPVEVPQNQ